MLKDWYISADAISLGIFCISELLFLSLPTFLGFLYESLLVVLPAYSAVLCVMYS